MLIEFPNRKKKLRSPRGTTCRSLAKICGLGTLACMTATGGSIFVSGHDADFHASLGPNPTGAQDLINRALDFARDGNGAPILVIQSDTSNISLGDHTDSLNGLISSGYSAAATPGNHFVQVNATQFLTINLSLYSALFIPSDHGGTLTGKRSYSPQ